MRLTESRLRQIIHESIRQVLNEGAESRNMSAAKHYIYQRQNCDEQQALKIIGAIKTDIPNVRLAKCKFILGVTRMYLDGELSNGNAIIQLNRTLKLVASDAHVNEYDQNLNGISCNDLIQRFKTFVQQDLQKSKDEMSKEQYSQNSDYTIVKIDTPEEAAKYGKYTSWCVTHNENMYDSYTNERLGRFYFCLKNGFENVPKQKGDGCPLDEYGLSMVAVSVNIDGSCNTVTCRWNHDNGGNDQIMTDKDVSRLIGRNFYEAFPPKTREELEATGKFKDGWCMVESDKGYNFVNIDGEYISEQWFDWIYPFREGFARVELNGKYNFINSKGEYLSEQWLDMAYDFREGFAYVELNQKYNFINTEGEIMHKQWTDLEDDIYAAF